MLGVSGGIAAYKAVEICRRLVDAGAEVSPVLTEAATRFVSALTFSALASHPARTSLWEGPEPIPHTTLGRHAELIVVAPATARLLGAYAAGISDDLLTATLLATRAPVLVCPAMHAEMWEHPAVVENLATLRRRGVEVLEPTTGRLAGGDQGAGRLAEPADIVAAAGALLARAGVIPRPAEQDLAGIRVLVTAGGTREPIDPVRFIGNRSSGKQGHALARVAVGRGAEVTLVTTTDLGGPQGATLVRVETASEMEAAVRSLAPDADVVIMAAAVADFRPKLAADRKLKKADGVPDLVLEPTADILAWLGLHRRARQLLVGFAAETATGAALASHAFDKLHHKHLDLVVANDISQAGAGFDHDTNAVVIVAGDGTAIEVTLNDKTAVASAVLDAVAARLPSRFEGAP